MYQFIGDINEDKVAGLASLLNCMSEHFFSKDGPAMNEHHYHIAKQHFNEEAHNIYNIDKPRTYNIQNNRHTDEHYHSKKQNITNSITNNISKQSII